MKYCTKCRNELFDEAVICPKCGCDQSNTNTKLQKQNAKGQAIGAILIILGIAIAVAGILIAMAQL